MRLGQLLFAIFFCCKFLVDAASQGSLQTIEVGKIEYTDLSSWGFTKSYQHFLLANKEDFVLSNRWSKLVFKINSRRAEVNGITVWLDHTILMQSNKAMIAKIDLNATILPIIAPTIPAKPKPIEIVVLDPGHGGKDPGNEVGTNQEKEYTLLIAKELRKKLSMNGIRVFLTRTNDTFIGLDDRPSFAKKQQADLFISLHLNGTMNNQAGARGVEVFCLPPAGIQPTSSLTRGTGKSTGLPLYPGNKFDTRNLLLAYYIQKSVVSTLKVEDRGIRRERFAVLRSAQMPAVLIECGFMSDPTEFQKLKNDGYRQEMVQAILDGILEYKRCMERKLPTKKVILPPKLTSNTAIPNETIY